MQISDQEYFRSCIARERHLGRLLGHQHIEECHESAGTLWAGNQALPKWTRDWRACGPLMSEHGLGIRYAHGPGPDGVARIGSTTVHFADPRRVTGR